MASELDLGLHFIVGLESNTLSVDEEQLLANLRPSGVILRAPNFIQDSSYHDFLTAQQNLLSSVKRAIGRDKFFIALDHEGGKIHRLPAPFTRFPAARTYASKAQEVGAAMGKELASTGINLFFGPVADIDTESQNPVIGTRAFGKNFEDVTRATLDFCNGLSRFPLLSCPKHFPGHGDTILDSHEELPTLDHSLESLEAREIKPFRALLDWGVPLLMLGHLFFPNIDQNLPSSLSPIFIKNLLRGKYKAKCILITDDCDMKAISEKFDLKTLASAIYTAGVDILLFNHNPRSALEIKTLLQNNWQSSAVSLKESEVRIQKQLATLPELSITQLSEELLVFHRALGESLQDA